MANLAAIATTSFNGTTTTSATSNNGSSIRIEGLMKKAKKISSSMLISPKELHSFPNFTAAAAAAEAATNTTSLNMISLNDLMQPSG